MILGKLILKLWHKIIKSQPSAMVYLLSEWIIAIYEDTESCFE